MSSRWDAEFAKHQAEQRRLRTAEHWKSSPAREADVLCEDGPHRWPEAVKVAPDKDEDDGEQEV